MKSLYVGTLVPNDVVTCQFLVLSKEVRQKKTGEPYLSLHLADRTGELEARMWDNVAEVMHTFERDDFVRVKGFLQTFQTRIQFTVHRLQRLQDQEVDFSDFFPCAERDSEQMFSDLRGIIDGIGNTHLRALLNAIFADTHITERYKIAPAAKTIHHACRGGLLEHVLSVCKLCQLTGPHYRNIDVDLLTTGAILHDIGKIEELSYARSFSYSAEGQLLGHIVIGLRLVGEKIARLPDFPPKLRALLEHMIISHHGELEFGSPKVPLFQEALLLHHLDNLDSKMEALRNALKRDAQIEGEFTGWVGALERSLLRKDRYLAEAALPEAGIPQAPIPEPAIAQPAIPQTATPQPVESAPPSEQPRPQPAPPLPSLPVPPEAPRNPRPERHDFRPVSNTVMAEKLGALFGERK